MTSSVDVDCIVRGCRVLDASVFPHITNGNLNAPTRAPFSCTMRSSREDVGASGRQDEPEQVLASLKNEATQQ